MSAPIFRAIRDPAKPERITIVAAAGAAQCRLGIADTLAAAAAAIARECGGVLLDPQGAVVRPVDVPTGGGGA